MAPLDRPLAPELVSRLLAWLPGAWRDLPWRRTHDPYAIWVSEVMLQQTQVATVVPYFERWLTQFPDAGSLARAPQEAVLKAWEGLGYYARARNLQRAAQFVLTRHGGQLPANLEALLALPGIGRYTAGAIASLAFGLREPVLDGNVRRVLCRVYDISQDARAPATVAGLWQMAAGLVEAAPEGKVGETNEALMELGALVCTPGQPACSACPLAAVCLAHARGVEAQRPVTGRRAATPHYNLAAAVIQDQAGRYLLARRPADGLLGGLWEFPGTQARGEGSEPQAGEDLTQALSRALHEMLGIELACQASGASATEAPIVIVRHAYTHFRITLHAFRCTPINGVPSARAFYSDVRWIAPGDLAAYPFPVTHLKILQALGGG